jgi:peptidoglycan/LPS O-acetylase OafA/YrhL
LLESNPANAAHTTYRPDIDGLRAIAVMAVVLHHASPIRFPGGFVGVDIFFVISGFLISSIILQQLGKGSFSFADFYARRVKRIFPALTLVLISTLAMAWFWLAPLDYQVLGQHTMAAGGFVSNLVLWSEVGYFDKEAFNKPLLHLWSLAIEEQFYIAWPLLLWALYRWRAQPQRLIVGLLIASLALNLYLVRTDTTAAFYNPLARFWELLMGAWLAARYTQASALPLAPAWRAHALSTVGLVLLAAVMFKVTPESRFPGWWAFVVTAAMVMLLAAGPQAWFNRYVLSSRPFVWIGLISYPLYLWHWPLLSFLHIKFGLDTSSTLRFGAVGLSIVLAWLTYRWLEKPIRSGRVSTRAALLGLLASMALIIGLGAWVHQQKGFADRYPPLISDMLTKGGRATIVEGWRDGDCMLDFELPPSNFKASCIDDKKPLVFLWGDSHAGSLYPGFKALQDSGRYQFGIGERSGAICPPILDFEPRPLCKSLNDASIEAIRQSRPDVVVLYAWWHHEPYDLANLAKTVQAIKDAGVPRIIMLGAVPYWRANLPAVLLEHWKKGPIHAAPPLRLPEADWQPGLLKASQTMRQRAQDMGIEFINGMDYFCNAEGCLTRLSAESQQPISYDYGHLTVEASTYYVQQIAPLIFKDQQP